MNKNIVGISDTIVEFNDDAEAAEQFFDALCCIADIVENKDFNRTNWNKIKIILEKAGL
jgi:hypothetical protein